MLRTPAYTRLDCSEEDIWHSATKSERQAPLRQPVYNNKLFALVNLFILTLNLLLLLGNITAREDARKYERITLGPARTVAAYKTERLNLSFWTNSPYVTSDQSHADGLWDAITSDGGHLGFISIDGSTRRQYDLKTVSLEGGDSEKYLVGLDVFHQLHCLNYLRKRLLGRNLTHVQDPLGDKHIPHCLESLRLSLQCSADLSMLPLRWIEGYAEPWPVFDNEHRCRDWSAILEWARRQMPVLDGKLVHPELGPVSIDTEHAKEPPSPDHIHFVDQWADDS